MENESEKELLLPCWVCGKRWERRAVKHYLYFNQMLVCSNHKGARKWYKGALELANERLRRVIDNPGNKNKTL